MIDISIEIHPAMVTWPGDPPVRLERRKSIEEGATSNVSELTLGTHTGTHVDPPVHFLPGGRSVEELPLEVLVGRARVVQLQGRRPVTVERLAAVLGAERPERLLIGTGNSELWAGGRSDFVRDYAAPDGEVARWLVERGLRLVGVDYLSVEPFRPSEYVVHHTFLRAGTVVVEGLNLSGVEPGEYHLVCLPLKIRGGDGAPARAVLIA